MATIAMKWVRLTPPTPGIWCGLNHGRAGYERRTPTPGKTLAQLEQEVSLLKSNTTEQDSRPWWERIAGRFENDQAFDEIVRLGREYRDSLQSEDP